MKNNWRHNLDPRDPEYMDPPTEEEEEMNRDMEEYIAQERAEELKYD